MIVRAAKNVWRLYSGAMERRPLITQMVTTGGLLGLGDVVSQCVIEKKHKTKEGYSLKRSCRFLFLGSFYIAPSLRIWFGVLQNHIHGPAKIAPLIRVFVDQALFSPFFLSSILINLRLLEGNSLELSLKRWRNDLFPIFTNGLMVWPAAQLINFYIVPPQYRVVFVQVIALFWNTYISYRTNLPTEVDPIDIPVIPV